MGGGFDLTDASDRGGFCLFLLSDFHFGDGVAIQISGGTGTVSTSGLMGINTAPLGSSNASQAFQNGQFGLGGNSGQIATTETEPASNPAGASGTRATAGMGDAFTSSFMAVPFANGNATVSLQRLVGKVVSRTCMRRRQARRSAAQGAGSAPLLPARMPFPILCR